MSLLKLLVVVSSKAILHFLIALFLGQLIEESIIMILLQTLLLILDLSCCLVHSLGNGSLILSDTFSLRCFLLTRWAANSVKIGLVCSFVLLISNFHLASLIMISPPDVSRRGSHRLTIDSFLMLSGLLLLRIKKVVGSFQLISRIRFLCLSRLFKQPCIGLVAFHNFLIIHQL